MGSSGFWQELKRRHVYRVTAAYVVVGWLLIQVATQVFPVFHLPDWIDQAVVLVILVGFPIALVLAWAFDATPAGIVRTDAVPGGKGTAPRPRSRRAGGAVGLIGMLLAAIAGGAWWQFHARQTVELRAGPAAVASMSSGPTARDPDSAQRNPGKGSPDTTPAAAVSDLSAAQPIPAKSVAVLPFVNMSGDPKEEYFSDGITEEILNALAQVPNLKVAARTSAFAFKGKEEDLRKVGKALGVATVLEGSVQRAGDEVRITAQLIDTRSGYHLWSEKYDRQLTSIFAVEDEISKAIADKLRVRLIGGAGQSLVAHKSVDPRAHDVYLRGLTWLATRSLKNASAAFRQAVGIDPDYASAWGALAVTDALLPAYYLEAQATALPRAEGEAKKALTLDPNTPSAYVALGMIHRTRWRWSDADAAFRRALTIAPGDAEAVSQYAQFLNAAGQFEAALREVDGARALDPLSPVVGIARTDILMDLHRYADAAAQAQQTVAAHPGFALGYFKIMDVAIEMHRYRDAERYARRAAELAGEDPDAYAQMVRGVADPSQRAAALRIVESASPQARWDLSLQTRMRWLVRLGARDEALNGLEQMAARHEGGFEGIFWTPGFDPIRDDPRFQAVLEKMGLPYRPEAATPASATTGFAR